MISLKDVLDGLQPEERRQLMYAFEHGIAQHILLPGNKFIGVHVSNIQNLKVETQVNNWAYGEVINENNK